MKWLQPPLWLEFAAAVLIALMISNIATAYIFVTTREARFVSAWAENMAERAAAFASAYGQAEEAQRASLLKAMAGPGQNLSLAAVPAVGAGDARDSELESLIRAHAGPLAGNDIRAYRVSFADFVRFHTDRGPHDHGARPRGPLRAHTVLVMAIELTPGQWLNGRFGVPLPFTSFSPVFFSGAVGVLTIVLAALWMARRIARPLRALETSATALTRGEPAARVPETGPPAVKAATRAFNAMSERLGATLESQRLILAAVAHDLRTPITAMRLRAELVMDEENRARIIDQLDEMQAMAEAVLDAARADRTGEPTRRIDLAALTESLAADLAEIGLDVTCAPAGPMTVAVRANEIRRVLRNLIENAVRYGARASVHCAMDRNTALVHVDDEGPGIPPDQLSKVFEPFARLEESRSRATGGHGLGLTIARLIARAHGGEVALQNLVPRGLRATLSLPLDLTKGA